MKKINRLIAFVTSVMLLSCLCISVGATNSSTEKGSIELMNPQSGVTYTASKVFDVTYDLTHEIYAYTMATDSPWLSSVIAYATPAGESLADDWVSTTANGLTVTKVMQEGGVARYNVTLDANDTSAFNAPAFAEYLMGLLDAGTVTDNNAVSGVAGETVMFSNLDLGYWLVIPSGSSADEPKLASLDTTDEDIQVYDKNEVPAVDKQIVDDEYHCGLEANDGHIHTDACGSEGAYICGFEAGDGAHAHSAKCYETTISEASVGDKVSFQLTSKIPDTTGYTRYFFVIQDTLSSGLTFLNNATDPVAVTVGGNALDSEYYSVKQDETDPQKISIVFNDVIGNKPLVWNTGDAIVVTYKALVNDSAAIDSANTNTAYVQFSNDPTEEGKFDPTDPPDEFDPNDPKYTTKPATGNGPTSTTTTYSTALHLAKYANEVKAGNELTGAKFRLTGTAANRVEITGDNFVPYVEPTEEGAAAPVKYWKLNDDTYTTTDPASVNYELIPAGETIPNNAFVLENGEYRAATEEEIAAGTGAFFQQVTVDTDKYASTEDLYMKETSKFYATKDSTNPVYAEAFVDEHGKLVFSGLGEGVYVLSEIVTPDGYNPIDDITITIVFDEGDETNAPKFYIQENVKEDEDGVADATTMNMNLDVVNNSGARLPQTGGIGTTIFYVAGSILLLGAVVILITKKRMNSEA